MVSLNHTTMRLLVVFWSLHTMESAEVYKEYKLEKLCGTDRIKRSLYLNNRPAIFTFNSTTNIRLRCHLELHLFATDFGFSVFTEAMRLDDTPTCMTDYVQFGRDFVFLTSHKSRKHCGTVKPTEPILDEDGNFLRRDFGLTTFTQRSYLEETDAEMDMWVEIHPTYGNNSKEIKLIVTPFVKSCQNSQFYRDYRHCPGSTKCIQSDLFCDGIINCPETPRDEQAEYCTEKVSETEDYYNVPLIMIAIVVILVMISLVAYFIRDVFVICRHLVAKTTTPEGRRPVVATPPSGEPQGGLRALRIQLSSDQIMSNDDQSRSAVTASVMPNNPPSYSEVARSFTEEPPPSYQSFL